MSSHNLTLPLIGRLNPFRRNTNCAPREVVCPQLQGKPATPLQVGENSRWQPVKTKAP